MNPRLHILIFWFRENGEKYDTWETTDWASTQKLIFAALNADKTVHCTIHVGL